MQTRSKLLAFYERPAEAQIRAGHITWASSHGAWHIIVISSNNGIPRQTERHLSRLQSRAVFGIVASAAILTPAAYPLERTIKGFASFDNYWCFGFKFPLLYQNSQERV